MKYCFSFIVRRFELQCQCYSTFNPLETGNHYDNFHVNLIVTQLYATNNEKILLQHFLLILNQMFQKSCILRITSCQCLYPRNSVFLSQKGLDKSKFRVYYFAHLGFIISLLHFQGSQTVPVLGSEVFRILSSAVRLSRINPSELFSLNTIKLIRFY